MRRSWMAGLPPALTLLVIAATFILPAPARAQVPEDAPTPPPGGSPFAPRPADPAPDPAGPPSSLDTPLPDALMPGAFFAAQKKALERIAEPVDAKDADLARASGVPSDRATVSSPSSTLVDLITILDPAHAARIRSQDLHFSPATRTEAEWLAASLAEMEAARAERARTSHAWAAIERAMKKATAKDRDGALASYQMAQVLDPMILTRLPGEFFCERGLRAVSSNDSSRALASFNVAIRRDPAMVIARRARAIVAFNLGHLDDALADFDAVVLLDPTNPRSFFERGATRADRGDLDAAIADYDVVLRLVPDHFEARRGRAHALSRRGDSAAAIAEYDLALRLRPDDLSSLRSRADALAKHGDLARAEADASAVVRLAPEVPKSYWRRADIREHRANYAGAADDYSAALRLEPFAALHYARRGLCREREGDAASAIADAESALRLDSSIPLPYYVRSRVRHAQGDHAGALADIDEAIRLQPAEIEYLFQRILILATACDDRVRDPEKAFDLAARARKLAGDGPSEHKALNFLAFAGAAAGDYRSAVACQVRAIRRDSAKTVWTDDLLHLLCYLVGQKGVFCTHANPSRHGAFLGLHCHSRGVTCKLRLDGVAHLRVFWCFGFSYPIPLLEFESSFQ